jgi:hypothetical protein
MDGLKNNETILIGSWLRDKNKVVTDDVCKRIDWLKNHYLKKITTNENGWEILYQDPNDKRYWILTYPNGDWHGGGPPTLQTLSQKEAQTKFKID